MGRPKIHLTAPRNWINDPNGFIYYKGEYHLFYQYFPYDCRWGTMHWGHAITKDFVHFLYIAKGSNAELMTHLMLCHSFEYIPTKEFQTVKQQSDEVGMLLNLLIRSLEKKM